MALPTPASLRDLYVPPSNAWSFIPPALQENASAASMNSSAPGPSSGKWSTRPAPNPLFELSSSFAGDDSGLDITSLAKELLAAALLQYATNAIAQPWEVGKTLLQVQWVPREPERREGHSLDGADDDAELSDSSNENESYFADPTTVKPPKPPRPADEHGYIIRQSLLEEGTQPEYVIPVGSADGTWGMMKRIGGFRSEGWLALWKGLLTTAVQNALTSALQPVIYSLLQTIFSPLSPSLSSPLGPGLSTTSVLLPVASQVLAGFLLSPLDLVRTRLIVQSSVPRHRAYSGPIDALRQILAQEGGIRGVYLHPHLLVPTLLDCTLRALVPLTLPGLVAANVGLGAHIAPETHPVQWNIAELLGGIAGSLVLLPFETVRHRLQVQTRGSARPLKACVEIRPAPYNGMVDAFWHILTEERSDLPLKTHRRRRRRSSTAKGKDREGAVQEDVPEESESWLRHSGIGQLYRGLGMRVGASVLVFVLALVGSPDESDGGWAEL
ncbi:Mitochondrial fusion and transport protein ugo1 [Trametes pubescens]|uniref:Mitochondrial fusion and transport protein ugo1 n=1 Tax=Trametes pubescens TaxID=154538 RepID=A0A1M2VPS5_TRAPU|nr:Mitochondrial fusion and transport protein ugo1 [Trametes pubescens]